MFVEMGIHVCFGTAEQWISVKKVWCASEQHICTTARLRWPIPFFLKPSFIFTLRGWLFHYYVCSLFHFYVCLISTLFHLSKVLISRSERIAGKRPFGLTQCEFSIFLEYLRYIAVRRLKHSEAGCAYTAWQYLLFQERFTGFKCQELCESQLHFNALWCNNNSILSMFWHASRRQCVPQTCCLHDIYSSSLSAPTHAIPTTTSRACIWLWSSLVIEKYPRHLRRLVVCYYCCNLSGGLALIVWFTTNGMCAKKNTIWKWCEQSIIEWSWQVNSIVACCHSAKLCALAVRAFPIATVPTSVGCPRLTAGSWACCYIVLEFHCI